MAVSRLLSRAPALAILMALFALSACSTNAANPQASSPTSTPTSAPTATPTLAPPACPQQFSTTYYSTLPNATYPETKVYAQIQLPPQTREHDDNATGHRFKFLCSAGTTDSVLAFMTQHLTQLGWQPESLNGRYCDRMDPNFSQQQCWKNGKYELFMGFNSNLDWALVYVDPGFIP